MKIGKLVITTTNQRLGSPFIDRSTTICREKKTFGRLLWRANGFAVLLTPWRRNEYRESLPQKALVIGWEV